MVNLVEGLTNEILRVTEILREYKELSSKAFDFQAFAITSNIVDIEEKLLTARKAQSTGDVLQMIPALKDLHEIA